MTDQTTVTNWVDGYQRAWASNAPDDIRALFTDDAHYRDAPFEEPRVGHEAIVAGWLEGRDAPGDYAFRVGSIAVAGDTGFVEAETDYLLTNKLYSNLWVIEFAPDGRASSFTEWYMRRPTP